jgi:hypothetical protein
MGAIMRSSFLSTVVFGLVIAACGGKGTGPAPISGGGGGGGGGTETADLLPWEAALSQGATFELVVDPELESEEMSAGPVTATVTQVETDGGARVYHLDWGEGSNGPTTIRVDHGVVTLNDAKPADMKEPFTPPGGATCYGEDMSNPDGCDDVCDADLCMGDAGIVSVDGLYAPDYSMYVLK